MASFNFYLKNPKATDTTPIYMLFDDAVNRAKVYVQLSVKPKDWNTKAGEARKTLQGYADFNSKLSKIQTTAIEYHTAMTNAGAFTPDGLKEKVKDYIDELNNRKRDKKASHSTLIDFAEHFITSAQATKKKNTLLQNRQTLKLLKEFEGGKRGKTAFENINLDFYNDFITFLTTTKGYSVNTIGKHVSNVKHFLNEATERGLNTKLDFKSKRFRTTSESVENIYLNDTELDLIYNYDFAKNKRLEQVRDLFMIGCYTGLRFSDFSQLKLANIHKGNITVKTQKTGETVTIPVHSRVMAILTKYADTPKGLPRSLSNQKMNEYLKELGRAVGITDKILQVRIKGGLKSEINIEKCDLITTHTARRSFATNLYLSGFPAISIMKITGHKTEKAFMKYIKISAEENANLLGLHWSRLKIA